MTSLLESAFFSWWNAACWAMVHFHGTCLRVNSRRGSEIVMRSRMNRPHLLTRPRTIVLPRPTSAQRTSILLWSGAKPWSDITKPKNFWLRGLKMHSSRLRVNPRPLRHSSMAASLWSCSSSFAPKTMMSSEMFLKPSLVLAMLVQLLYCILVDFTHGR